jgi:Dyp-type peroxidase family
MAKLISSKHLESVSDLTLTAPIKQGFIDAFEAVTYETRLGKLLEALFKIRSTAREYSKIKPFVDSAERIQSLLDYRLAILDDCEPHRLMLSATFDKPFEPYMRLIWRPLGPLLDVIFCNCDGYVTATGHNFPQYLDWVRRAQVDTNFFYSANGFSVGDVDYLLKVERLIRENQPISALQTARPAGAEEEARLVRAANGDETDQLGMEALVSLYRLTDFYPPDSPDGAILRRATQQLLAGWAGAQPRPDSALEHLIREQLFWFRQDMGGSAPIPAATNEAVDERWLPRQQELIFKPGDIQGGILIPYGSTDEPVRHGALLLMRIIDPEKARTFIDGLKVQRQGEAPPQNRPFLNLAFTCRGLANIGVAGSELAKFPQEFREGMEERAGLLGDLRDSHPRRWTLPDRNWPDACRPDAPRRPVDMSEIDLVIQLRTTIDHEDDDIIGDAEHPLHDEVARLGANPDVSGVRLLAVQPMRRADPDLAEFGREHFGFRDGISQPRVAADGSAARGLDEVARGELLLGYANDRSDPPPRESVLMDNGTFLVVRKLRQDVVALRQFAADMVAAGAKESLYAKMMGRTRTGDPAELGVSGNSFDYASDPDGRKCPFQSHTRRTNPRTPPDEASGRPTPRILRRGLSYGPWLPDDKQEAEGADRGVVFMAYNASIAEQYEVIQRWVNGGNSTGIASWHNDPVMGVPPQDGPRIFCFSDAASDPVPLVLPKAFAELQWGMYLFVPSIAAIDAIVQHPETPFAAAQQAQADDAERGSTIIAKLRGLAGKEGYDAAAAAAAWKTCLEDFGSKDPAEKAEAQAVWAAIRRDHGGALRVPYGAGPEGSPKEVVLVAGRALVNRSLEDPAGVYSMCRHMDRMKKSFGEIFLGMDKNDPETDYALKSAANGPISEISEQEAFAVARTVANEYLRVLQGSASRFPGGQVEIDLRREFITTVLAGICNHFFGIPDALLPAPAQYVDPFGWSWEPVGERHPRCPGDFMAPSRYCFYPDPVQRAQVHGEEQGQALKAAVARYLAHKLGRGRANTLPGKLSDAIARLKAPDGSFVYVDEEELASTIVGVMTGFLPPADGCLRLALYEWIQEKTLWRVQQDLLSHASPDPFVRAKEALRPWLARAMQKRPAPDILWRTVTGDDQLGSETVKAGDRIVIGLVSALAEDAAADQVDVYPVFGGNRAPTDGTAAPVHACPGYQAAMGSMLGMLSALLENCGIETLPAPLLVRLSFDIARIEVEIAAAKQARAAAEAAVAAGGGSGG